MGTRALTLPPRAGWIWLQKGLALFRKNPSGALVLAASYLGILTFLMVLIPYIGTLMVAVLTPGLNAGLMTGCRMIDRGLPITPSVILSPFLEENRRLAKPFLRLGVIYAVCVAIVSVISSLFIDVDLPKLMEAGNESGQLTAALVNMLAISVLLYTPVMMMFWYAPTLLLWHDIEPRKALFFSAITVWRNRGPFLIYGMGWLLWMFGIVGTAAVLLSLIQAPGFIAVAMNFVLVMGVFAFSLCTFYPSYMDVFETTADA